MKYLRKLFYKSRWKFKLIISVLSLITLVVLQVACAKDGYYINYGFDFANGQYLSSKSKLNGNQQAIWTKCFSRDSKEDVYKKYGISHDKPVITYISSMGYEYCWFKIDRVPWNGPWWRLWRHEYYILNYRPAICRMGRNCYGDFFTIIKKFSPPKQEVQKIYQECIALNKDWTKIRNYLEDRYDFYNKDNMKKLYTEICEKKTLKNHNDYRDIFRKNNSDIIEFSRYIKKNRKLYPKQLPDNILTFITSKNLGLYCLRSDKFDFITLEYKNYQSKKNALYLVLAMTQPNKCDPNVSGWFDQLHKLKLLKKFLNQVMPADLSWLPPLPKPEPEIRPKEIVYDVMPYYTDTYENLPERDSALQMTFNYTELRKYWHQQLKKLN